MKRRAASFRAVLLPLFAFALGACDFSIDAGMPTGESSLELREGYRRNVDFKNYARLNVSLKGLFHNDVFLVKTNHSLLTVEDTGSVVSSESKYQSALSNEKLSLRRALISADKTEKDDAVPGRAAYPADWLPSVPFAHYRPAQEWNNNPPPFDSGTAADGRSAAVPEQGIPPKLNSANAAVPLYGQGHFWVETGNGWEYIPANLIAESAHSKVWTAYDADSIPFVTVQEAEKIARREDGNGNLTGGFDLIYEVETSLLGYEYGGGPGGSGGVDGDPKINILLYDIYDTTIAGFFWSKDYYSQKQLDTMYGDYKSNNAEIFYVGYRYALEGNINFLYSTLIHEFQHMIHFNKKYIGRGLSSPTWYNEMLSMLAEDMLYPIVVSDTDLSGHPLIMRMPNFLSSYGDAGLTNWLEGIEVLKSYAYAYAFGAYLTRNYGGAALVTSMLNNNTVGADSVSLALAGQGFSGGFDGALSKFGETLVYKNPPEGIASFYQTVSRSYNGRDFTFSRFDVFSLSSGPVYFSRGSDKPLQPSGLIVEKIESDFSGNLSLTLTGPRTRDGLANSDVDVYFLIK